MKSLSLSQPLVIMMVGLPGAGKSFFARQFSETFGAPLVSYDRIRYELFPEPSYSSDEQELIGRIAQNQLEELFKTRRTFILDGGWNARVNRSKIEQLARQNNYQPLVIWVQTDPATCQARAGKRSSRRQDDMYNSSLTTAEFDKQARALTPPTHENYAVISGKHTYSTQARVILKKLAAPHEEKAEEAHKAAEPTRPTPSAPGARRSVTIR